jgi:hypothetical protein
MRSARCTTAAIFTYTTWTNFRYCCGWDLRGLIYRGFGVSTAKSNRPAAPSAHGPGQIVNFFYTLQARARAPRLLQLRHLPGPFIRFDNLTYKQVTEHAEFIFNLNVPTRVVSRRRSPTSRWIWSVRRTWPMRRWCWAAN